ncbi:MAG: hypothetical protein P1Q69_01475 [Candidatus Thorarchaeota archaeon]|nr:hypothetical protein [Candidatus Thorarchaeota archaeon]
MRIKHITMKGLGIWPNLTDRVILKARRKKSFSKGKSSLLSETTDFEKGEFVADCSDLSSHMKPGNSKDPAMTKTVEKPSAITGYGACDTKMQRTEARSHLRNDIPMRRGKAHGTLKDTNLSDAGDSGHEKGGTQNYLDGSFITNRRLQVLLTYFVAIESLYYGSIWNATNRKSEVPDAFFLHN